MSASTYKLRVEASDPLAAVEVVGADYVTHMKGGRSIDYAAAPGLYIARAKFRDRVEEKAIRIRNKDEHIVFSSSALTDSEDHEDSVAQTLSRKVVESRAQPGQDTWITLAIKGVKQPRSRTLEPAGLRVTDFCVCTLGGELVKPFSGAVIEQALPEAAVPGVYPGEVASVDLPVGWYAMSMPGRGQTRVMLPLYVSDRFSPTVFIETTVDGPDDIRIDFDKLLVSYDPDEHESVNDLLELRAIEAARRSLELGRNTLTPSLMEVLLKGKVMNPMLGLLALQLMLLPEAASRNPNPLSSQLFNEVIDKVSGLLGANHPDLVLARARARKRKWHIDSAPGDEEPLVAPPLLKANWQFLNSMPGRRRELTARGKLLYEVGRSLLQTGIWVVWKPPTDRLTNVAEESLAAIAASVHSQRPRDASVSAAVAIEGEPHARRAKKRRTADQQLEGAVDLIRGNSSLQAALLSELSSTSLRGSVLDRTVAKAALQLAGFSAKVEQSVPKGYASQLARNLSLPLPVVRDSIMNVERALKQLDRHGQNAAASLDDTDVNQFLY